VLAAIGWALLYAPLPTPAQQPEAQQPGSQPPARPPHPVIAAPGAPRQPAGPLRMGRVEGKIEGHPEADRTVMLLQFRLNAEGQPEGGPIGRAKTAEGGTYVFTDVPIDPTTVYRLGTRIDEKLVGSDPFSFGENETVVMHDLRMPSVKSDTTALRARELMWVAEARTGHLWITEVLHLENPGKDTIALERAPLEMPLPPKAEEVEVLRMDLEEGHDERLGPKLLISGNVPPGVTVIAFRYRVSAPLGRADWSHTYAFPVGQWRVISPDRALRAEGEGLTAGEDETYDGVTYSVWSRQAIEPGTAMPVRFSGAPISQWILLTPLLGFGALLAALLIWYARRRARQPEASAAG